MAVGIVGMSMLAASAHGDTLHVPGDRPTIQGAIDAAVSGSDEIIVAPGTYVENIDFAGKNIALRALNPSVELGNPMDPSAASIIDGSQPVNPNFGSAVRFSGTEDPTCILDGFTVTGGTGVMQASGYTKGGGIYGGDGGASWVWTQATIVDCTIRGNTARFGGGLSKCGGTITNCNITANWTYDPGGSNHGGGGLQACNGTIRNCTITDNSASEGGALYSCRGLIINCDITGNQVTWSGGAMIFCDDATLVSCNISGNTASLGGLGAGGAVFSSRTTYINCTLANNSANRGGAIYAYHSFAPTMSNCIIWGNTATNGPQIALNSSGEPTTLVIAHSDLEGGEDDIWLGDPDNCFIDWGDGMLGVNPLFAGSPSGDLRLSPGSPCINTGDPNFVAEPGVTDLDGHARVLCGRVDMGAYEFGVGDYDCSQVVDLGDFATWDECVTGPSAGPYLEGCEAVDFEFDGDVDLQDFAAFQGVFGSDGALRLKVGTPSRSR